MSLLSRLRAIKSEMHGVSPGPSETSKHNSSKLGIPATVLSASKPPLTSSSVTDPTDLIADYLERLAICAETGNNSAITAHRIATVQCGASLEVLATQQLAFWRARLLDMEKPGNYRLRQLPAACIGTLEEPWLCDAILYGWDANALFGLDPAAPAVAGCNGLITGIAITALSKPVRVLGICSDHARIVTASGSELLHFNTGRAGPPVWMHPAFRHLQ